MKKEIDEFKKYKEEISRSVLRTKKKISKDKSERKYVNYSNYPLEKIRRDIIEIIRESLGIQDKVYLELVFPPPNISADISFEVFNLSKKIKKDPNKLATEISEAINIKKNNFILQSSSINGFVNLSLNTNKFYKESLKILEKLGENFGENNVYAGKIVVLDYSSPNIAKPIGVGHLRSTIIGQSLANLYSNSGYSCIKDNHLGDWGTQFGALLYAYINWGKEEKIENNPIKELKDLYVKFHKVAKDKPKIKEEAKNYFSKLEKMDPELVSIWKRFRDLSIKDFDRVYKMLNVRFDLNIGESYFIDKVDKIIDDCQDKNLCRIDKETGAVVVDEYDDMPSFLLRKNDGASVYMARDIATIIFRIKKFDPNVILYVVGSEQELNFKQMFSLCKRAGYLKEGIDAEHIGFGLVLREGKKMSTRRGTLIELDDLIEQSINKSKQVLRNKNSRHSNKELEKIAKIIGIGAIIYNDLRQSRVKNISFDWERMLDLEGGSAVYLQYTYVRINSILKKLSGSNLFANKNTNFLFERKIELDIAKKLMFFPRILLRAQEGNQPHYVALYLEELAQMFNSFYNEISIVNTDKDDLKNSRLFLARSVASTIKKGLSILNIEVPDKM